MQDFLKRISSRKFLESLAASITAIVVLVNPASSEVAGDWRVQITALVVLALVSLGYMKFQGDIDKANGKK